MSLQLPEPFEGTLPGSPLALVACQVRYVEAQKRLTPSLVFDLYKALKEAGQDYQPPESVRLQTITIDPSNLVPATSEAASAWRLTSEDRRWIISISPDAYSIETQRYKTWANDFRDRLQALTAVLTEQISPTVQTRIGLRYVDNFGPESSNFRTAIVPSLLGPLSHPDFGAYVQATQQQFVVNLAASIRATVRHGLILNPDQDSPPSYLLDTDVYLEDMMRMDGQGILQTVETLHRYHLQIFRACITDLEFDRLGKPAKR